MERELFLLDNDPLMTITECDFYLAGNLAVLAGDNQLDPAELILRQAVIENLKHAIDAAIEFSLLRFRIVGTAHTIWQEMEALMCGRRPAN